MNPDQELRSLKRGLKVLSLLNQVETIGITELARRLELPRTTAERILVTLATEGYVQRLPNDKRYRLSAKVFSLSRGFSDDCRVVQVATSLLFSMTHRIGWPMAIATPSGDSMVLRITSDPATSLWLNRRRIGAETPMLASSSGLVAYAFASPVEQENLLSLLKTSKHEINRERANSPALLNALIAPVVEKGYAFQPPPNDMPERSISVPIRINGEVIAVLLLMYMPRALSTATVLNDYLPMLETLASEIADRVSPDGDVDEDDLGGPELPLSLQSVPTRMKGMQFAMAH